MKQHTVPALGLLLSGCAVQGNPQPEIPADNVVDQMIAVNTQKVSFVQQQLLAALTPVLPAPARTPPKNPPLPVPPRTIASAPTPAASARWPALTSTGQRKGLPALATAGSAPTLRQALAKIVPPGWSIHYDMGLKPEVKRPLTWQGNDQWPYVLNRLLAQEKMRAEINWTTQKVSVSQAGVPAAVTPTVKTTPGKTTGKNPFTGGGGKTFTSPVANPVSVVKPPTARPVIWQASVGITLKDTLLEWTTREKCTTGGNWKLAWNTTVNYRIDAPLAFSGSFRQAVNDLFILYGTASTPLYAATQSAQCVLLVDDKEPR
ncbi:MAG: toxin co-regulated pilus biosynthesis Q family protein [Citrobacter sp.]|uniref:toxin co-regulated pilus biosynthesis Q family protein n=1 Tax=Citrobacter sp. TaxID=1896336 RepID=UPI002FCC453F